MSPSELIKKSIKDLGIPLTEEQLSVFLIYLAELKKWNRAYNLTALKTDEDIIIKHFIDSLLYLKAMPESTLKLADIGTGAGFPGIPLKIIRPELQITLIDSSRKKAAFLRNIIRLLNLENIYVLQERIEDIDTKYKYTFDIIVSRATFSIKEFIITASPYLKEKGILILNKGPKVHEELKGLKKQNESVYVKEVKKFRLPVINAERNIVVLEPLNPACRQERSNPSLLC